MTQPPHGLFAHSHEDKEGEIYPLDENLAIADEVVAALATDPRTAAAVIEVVYEQGVLTLLGDVRNEATHVAAEEIARGNARVLSVVNALEVRPVEEWLVAMSPTRIRTY